MNDYKTQEVKVSIRPIDTVDTMVLSLHDITKSFIQGKEKLDILRGVNFAIAKGETIALLGPSGSGKSTLLNIAGLLERPDKGEILLSGHDITSASDILRTEIRRDYIGFVYQNHNLLPEFTALENVMIPQLIAKEKKSEAKERALWLLTQLELKDRVSHHPSELSGGEQQRVAIARALANRPHLLLADEPTGNLDDDTSEIVFELLVKIIKQTGLSAFIATHNPDLAVKMDKRVSLKHGKLIGFSDI